MLLTQGRVRAAVWRCARGNTGGLYLWLFFPHPRPLSQREKGVILRKMEEGLRVGGIAYYKSRQESIAGRED